MSSYYSNDLLGNLWTVEGSGKSQSGYEDTTGFGAPTALAGVGGATGTPFGYGGGNGCQTDADTGLILMGHRYYDTRIGRFISQDPVGDGDNWYAYAGNNPVDETDPTGLSETTSSFDSSMGGQVCPGGEDGWSDYENGDYGTYNMYGPNGSGDGKQYYMGTLTVGPSALDIMMQGGMGLNMGSASMGGRMFAENESYRRPGESKTHYFFRGLWWAVKQFATLQPAPGEGYRPAPGQREINKVPDLTGKTRAEVDGILKGRGFKSLGKTAGGYEKYTHPDGGKIQIGPDGEISRSYGSKGMRVDQFGNEGRNHNTGEIVSD